MGWPLAEVVAVLVAVLATAATACVVVSPRLRARGLRAGRVGASGLGAALGVRRLPPPPPGRPIEVVAREARRIGRGYRATREGVSFAKSEAFRRAYDAVLAEGCERLGVPHLLGLLPEGEELDAERVRVERVLHGRGLDLDDAA